MGGKEYAKGIQRTEDAHVRGLVATEGSGPNSKSIFPTTKVLFAINSTLYPQ